MSMIGRQMMGRIDARMQQAVPGSDASADSLGGMSLVCIGDPAQCQALFDQQIYDVEPHAKTMTNPLQQDVQLSNKGLDIYREIDLVIVLSAIRRLSKHTAADGPSLTEEQQAYNDRADRFLEVLHRVRDLKLSTEDYYWLCGLKNRENII